MVTLLVKKNKGGLNEMDEGSLFISGSIVLIY